MGLNDLDVIAFFSLVKQSRFKPECYSLVHDMKPIN